MSANRSTRNAGKFWLSVTVILPPCIALSDGEALVTRAQPLSRAFNFPLRNAVLANGPATPPTRTQAAAPQLSEMVANHKTRLLQILAAHPE
jgi:hypothetical protein